MPREKSIAERFEAYVDAVGGRLHKPNRRFLRDALFGLLENRSVLLSEIGRALDEPRRLIHTEKRLSRGLASPRYNDAAVEADYLKLVASALRDERYPRPVIAVDLTDIAKPKAKKMPYLARVHDGSKNELATGYEVVSAEAVGVRGRRLPLLARLFSSKAPGSRSQPSTVLDAVSTVAEHVPKDAFWVFDKGFDGKDFFQRFNDLHLQYAVRLRLNVHRILFVSQKKTDARSVADTLPRPYQHRCRALDRKRPLVVNIGWANDVQFVGYRTSGFCTGEPAEGRYSVVVASSDISREPLAILTNFEVRTSDDAARVVDAYLGRWGVEEANQFVKQGFDLENVRALTWTGLRRMVQLVYLAYGFLASLVHGPREQTERIAATFKAFGPVPTYLYYRLLEGIGRVLRRAMDSGP